MENVQQGNVWDCGGHLAAPHKLNAFKHKLQLLLEKVEVSKNLLMVPDISVSLEKNPFPPHPMGISLVWFEKYSRRLIFSSYEPQNLKNLW